MDSWWGHPKRKVAHFFASDFNEDTACGRVIFIVGSETRLDPETGKPWRKCKQCVAALAASHPITEGPR